jgi:hypothetical protein
MMIVQSASPELISLFEIAKVLAYPAPSAMKSADSGLKYL